MPDIGGVTVFFLALQYLPFRMIVQLRDQRMDLQIPEIPGEVDMLCARDVLIAEEDHLVLD